MHSTRHAVGWTGIIAIIHCLRRSPAVTAGQARAATGESSESDQAAAAVQQVGGWTGIIAIIIHGGWMDGTYSQRQHSGTAKSYCTPQSQTPVHALEYNCTAHATRLESTARHSGAQQHSATAKSKSYCAAQCQLRRSPAVTAGQIQIILCSTVPVETLTCSHSRAGQGSHR